MNVLHISLFACAKWKFYSRSGIVRAHHPRQNKEAAENQKHDYRAGCKRHWELALLFSVRGFSRFHRFPVALAAECEPAYERIWQSGCSHARLHRFDVVGNTPEFDGIVGNIRDRKCSAGITVAW